MKKTSFLAVSLLISISVSAQVRFDACFEGGSMGKVSVNRKGEYVVRGSFDPANPVDSLLRPSADWYFWRMTGIKDSTVTVILPDAWQECCSYSYDGISWMNFLPSECSRKGFTKHFERDTCYVAPFIPYTYSHLRDRMKEWGARKDVEIYSIGESSGGRPLEVLHITDGSLPEEGKKRVWMHGRTHPSESPSSYALDALIEYLTSDSPEAGEFRRKIDFRILPFSNPDGVALGLSRSNATGINQEINFGRSPDSTCVEVRAIKKEFERLTRERPLDLVLNHHSQKGPYATLWMHTAEGTSKVFQTREWVFSGLCASFNPYISCNDISFSKGGSRYAEGWFWDNFGERTMALTVETPFISFSENTGSHRVNVGNLGEFGRRILQASAEYLGVTGPGKILVDVPSSPSGSWTDAPDSLCCLSSRALLSEEDGSEITYRLDYGLPPGRYHVYRHLPGFNIVPEKGDSFAFYEFPGRHGWKYEGYVFLLTADRFEFSLKAKGKGDCADMLMLVYEK